MTDPAPTLQTTDVERLERIYEDQFSYVWNTLRRLGIPERNLEDVAHDVFVVVQRKLADFDPSRPVKPWLFGISFRVVSDHKKKRANREVLEDELQIADTSPSAEDSLIDAEARRLVIEALGSLDEDRRAVFVMHEIDEIPAPEIAAVLGIPVNTVYSRLRVARERFEKAVQRLRARGGLS